MELLAGLYDEITLDLVVPKLPAMAGFLRPIMELKLYRGRFLQEDSDDERGRPSPSVLKVYHPAQDKWRVGDAVGDKFSIGMVFSQGKFHRVTENGIDFYDNDTNTWSHLHSNSFDALGPAEAVIPTGVLAFNDELILAVEIYSDGSENSTPGLLLSKAFGSGIETLVWQNENFTAYFGSTSDSRLITLQIQLFDHALLRMIWSLLVD
ncbi:unnamed protein product [Calypogeia fissa]